VGRSVDGEELAELLLRDEPFFRASGGGVTLSGGEPTLHLDLAADVASRLRGRGVHVLLETCGHFPYPPFAERLLPHLDVIYLDLKIVDPALHERHTGKSNGRVLDNLRKLAALAAPEILVRLPLVPRVTATDENVRAVAEVVRGLGLERLALLPYNPLWLDKARALGRRTAYDNEKWMTDAEVERCREIVRDGGLTPL